MNDEGRLIIGSIGCLDAQSYAIHKAWAYRKMTNTYSQLKGMTFIHKWHGRIRMSNK